MLSNATSNAWLALFGVLFGAILTIIGVSLTNASNTKQLKLRLDHEERMQRGNLTRERLEELYMLVSRWTNAMFAMYARLTLVMKGEIDYNQYNDMFLNDETNKGIDFSRMDMIVGVYGGEVERLYQKCMEARDEYNHVVSAHKTAYRRGDSGRTFLEPLMTAQLRFSDECEKLKTVIAREASKV